MANLAETMAELERGGSESVRKIWRRHGFGDNVFGVKTPELAALKKRIKTDHALAQQLWDTDNYDARILAGMIADPQQATPEMLDSWAHQVKNRGVCDELARFAIRTPYARQMAEKWIPDPDEWISMTGWDLLGEMAFHDLTLPDSYFEAYLDVIVRDLKSRPNYTRHAMNGALIAIGTRSAALHEKARAAAQAIGKVVVDHGQTDCKTPEAVGYMQKTIDRKGYVVK